MALNIPNHKPDFIDLDAENQAAKVKSKNNDSEKPLGHDMVGKAFETMQKEAFNK